MMKNCGNCGLPFEGNPADGFCMPCEYQIQAVEPPQVLKDLRSVYEGDKPRNKGMVVLWNLMQKNPKEFLGQLKAAEKEWREQVAKVKEAEPDEKQVKVEELIDRLLEGLQ